MQLAQSIRIAARLPPQSQSAELYVAMVTAYFISGLQLTVTSSADKTSIHSNHLTETHLIYISSSFLPFLHFF